MANKRLYCYTLFLSALSPPTPPPSLHKFLSISHSFVPFSHSTSNSFLVFFCGPNGLLTNLKFLYLVYALKWSEDPKNSKCPDGTLSGSVLITGLTPVNTQKKNSVKPSQ